MKNKIPEYREYVGKSIRFTGKSIVDYSDRKGLVYRIHRIEKGMVTLKLLSTQEESAKIIASIKNSVLREGQKTIDELTKSIELWDKNPKDFEKIPRHWEYERGEGSHINTGYYQIPADHPNKAVRAYPSDGFYTYLYKHKKVKKGYYSYQQVENVWYSRDCYYFMKLGDEEELKVYKESPRTEKEIYTNLSRLQQIPLRRFNQMSWSWVKKPTKKSTN